jgi:WD40 repeat protein/serine/threonine protein kinase
MNESGSGETTTSLRGDETPSAVSPDELAIMQFVKDLDATSDPEDTVRRHSVLHPHLAGEFEELAAMQGRIKPAPGDAAEEPPPQRLGDFQIVDEIGRGGMGMVYEAVQEPFQRRVAVKTVRADVARVSRTTRTRFLREQRVLAKLHHTHIVPIHAAGRAGSLHYYAMHYIEGAALSQVVASVRNLRSSSPNAETPSMAELAESAERKREVRPASETPPFDGAGGGPGQAGSENAPGGRGNGSPGRLSQRSATSSNGRLQLSTKYLRSVAKVMADAADALQHAHEVNIFHRDVKPSNIMVDRKEHCWVLDFGLATLGTSTNGAHRDRAARDQVGCESDVDLAAVVASGVLGTPSYMAPEQFAKRFDARSDVWGLGVTLYELLTLRRAFGSKQEILSAAPHRPRDIVDELPLDLEAICLKAIRKEPGDRYQSAGECRDDLRRWLGYEPVNARPARALRRTGLWARRNKGWAVAFSVTFIALVAAGLGGVYVSKIRADTYQSVAFAAEREAQSQRREAMLQQMQRINLTYQRQDWSRDSWSLARRVAAESPAGDRRIQAEVARSLAGLDAKKLKSLALPATGLALDPSGARLLISGSSFVMRGPEQPIQIWDSRTDQLQSTEIHGDGVFGFLADGTPLLFTVPRTQPSIANLWDVSKGRLLRTFKSPVEGKSTIQDWTITPGGSTVAISAVGRDTDGQAGGTGTITVLDAATGREVYRSTDQLVTEIALAPDGSLLAAGHQDGEITVRSLPRGELTATLKADRNAIRRLAFGRDPVRGIRARSHGSGWLLAAGDAGGGVIVWDLRLRIPRSICHGAKSSSEIFALAFSPDGMTLASAGRGSAILWDIASGQFLLDVRGGNYVKAVAFSPDGKRLAVGSVAAFAEPDGVVVWELEPGRGIGTLRGLLRSVWTSIFSADGRLVAALSEDWRVGIWDRATHRLLHLLEVTPGSFTDNAAMAFSPDGRRFAFSGGHEASLWDVKTGDLLKTWRLHEGLSDRLAFPEPNHLLLFRVETETADVGPSGGEDSVKHPRVCRVRDLLSAEPLKALAVISDFNLDVLRSECSLDGKYYVVDGLRGTRGNSVRLAHLYEGRTGKFLGSLPQNPVESYSRLKFDPTGTVLSYFYKSANEDGYFFLQLPSGSVLRHIVDKSVWGLGPRANRWLTAWGPTADQPSQVSLHEQNRNDPLVKFILESATGEVGLSRDGLHLVWGNPNGAVTVVDLGEVNRRLSELGLGW